MKKKLCCILMLSILLLNSSIMLVVSEAIDKIQTNIEKSENIKALAEINLTKYENFDTTIENSAIGNKGALVQFNLKTGIEFAERQEYKPIQKTNTNIELPWIGDYKPERVEVLTKSTQATNGGKEAQYEYHASTGILEIRTENKEYVEDIANARDEYEIFCIYRKECYSPNSEERNIKIRANIEEIINDENSTRISTRVEQEYTVTENINGTISVEHQTEEIYNGYITANSLNPENKYETTYNEKLNIMISNKQLAQKIEIRESSENSLYMETGIDKNQVLEVLGDKGSIEILDENGNILKTINKDTETDEDGKIKVTYENRVSNITVQIKDIAKEGIIEVQNVRVIEPTVQVTDNKISTQVYIKGINTITREVQENNKIEKEIKTEELVKYERQEQIDTEIKQAVSSVDVKLDNDVLVNNTENNIILTATLRTDNPQYSLFKNPTISIEMPSEVEEVAINTPEVMYDNAIFRILESSVSVNDKGNKVLTIKLQGAQTSYEKSSLVKGTNIRIPLTMNLKRDIENKVGIIKIGYSNEITSTVESKEIEVSLLNKVVTTIPNIDKITTNEENEIINNNTTIYEENGIQVDIMEKVGNALIPNNGILYEQQIVKYSARVTNSSNTTKKVSIIIDIPDEMAYAKLKTGGFIYHEDKNYYEYSSQYEYQEQKDKQVKIELSVNANETKTDFIEFKVKDLPEDLPEKSISIKQNIQVDGKDLKQIEVQNIIKQAEISVELGCSLGDVREEWHYLLIVKNLTNKELKNVNIFFEAPEFFSIYNIQGSAGYFDNLEGNTWTYTIDNLEGNQDGKGERNYLFKGNIKDVKPNSDFEYKMTGLATISGNDISTYVSNETRMTGYVENIELEMKADKDTLKMDDEIIYTVNIKNTGKLYKGYSIYTNVNIKDVIPRELEPISIEYNDFKIHRDFIKVPIDGGAEGDERTFEVVSYTEENVKEDISSLSIPEGYDEEDAPNINLDLTIPESKEITMQIKAKAKMILDTKKITNTMIATGEYIQTKTASVESTILKYDYEEPVDPDKPIDPDKPVDPDKPDDSDSTKISISGIAWKDENEDGKRTTNESTYSGMEVILYDYKNNAFIKENGKIKTVITNTNGEYKFDNLEKGQYIVIFLYDTDKYKLTEYQKDGVMETKNNDAITKIINIEHEKKTAGITNTLIADFNLENIDIGLIENKRFDFEIQKYVNKIIVQTNDNKVKTYEYNNEKLAKVEIHSKKINGATVIIEYKILVTNKGEVPGKVVSIIDKIPNGLNFKSELNKEWYECKGGLCTNSLAQQTIPVGESGEVMLTLTKEVDSTNLETIKNIASISISNNDKAIEDENNQNNNSNAEVIIGVSTGLTKWIGIISFILVICIIIGILIWKNKQILKITLFVIMFSVVLVGSEYRVFGYNHPSGIKGVNEGSSLPFDAKYSVDESGRKYHCATQGATFCDNVYHPATFFSRKVISSSITGNWNDNIYLSLTNYSNSNNIRISKIDNYYNKIGPFKVNSTIWNAGHNVTVYYRDKNGNSNTTVGECINFSWGGEFYVKIPNTAVEVAKIQVGATYNCEQTRTVEESCYYYYHCSYLKDNISDWWCQNWAPKKGIQDMRTWDVITETYTETKNVSKGASVDIIGPWKANGDLILIKTDNESNKNLSNVEFRLKDSSNRYMAIYRGGQRVDKIVANEILCEQGIVNGQGGYIVSFNASSSGATKLTTNSSGKITIRELFVDQLYTFEEINNPNYGYTQKINVIANNLQPQQENIYKAENKKQVGNIEITKTDENNSKKVLPGVEFILKSSYQNKYIKVKASGNNIIKNSNGWVTRAVGKVRLNDTSANDKNQTITYTDSIGEATKFVTNEKGYLCIENLLMSSNGKDKIKYQLLEVKNPNYGYLSYENGKVGMNHGVKFTGNSVTSDGYVNIPRNETTKITIKNKQEYIRLEGRVWEEIVNSKNNKIDSVYQTTDALAEGIKVYLYKNGKVVATRVTDKNGKYMFGTKKANGEEYKNEDYLKESNGNLKIDVLDQYSVEFEYDGLRFTSVKASTDYLNQNYINTSKATEVPQNRIDRKDRANLNSDFSEIRNNMAVNNNGGKTYDLTYDFKEHISTYKDYWGYEYNQDKTRLKVTPADYYEIIASTQASGFNLKSAWEARCKNVGAEYLTGVNLGIYRREQADLAISEDLNKVNIVVDRNDGGPKYENTYTYEKRAEYQEQNENNPNYDVTKDGFGVDVKFGNNLGSSYSNRGLNIYTRRIYESDLALENQTTGLMKVYVTYKMRVKNQTVGLNSKVSELVNYYDARYEITESWLEDGTKVNWTSTSKNQSTYNKNGYIAAYTQSIANKVIGPNGYIDVYIKFSLKPEAIKELIQKQTTLNNVAEISAFSTMDKNNKIYAAIDEDSNPGSAKISLVEDGKIKVTLNGREYEIEKKTLDNVTFEDDTDLAPSLVLGIEEGEPTRGLSGTVFEEINDIHNDYETHAGEERLGNGILNEKDKNRIANAKVELLNSDGSVAKLHKISVNNGVISSIQEDAILYTNDQGYYEFLGVIPGRYLLRYTYGTFEKDGNIITTEIVKEDGSRTPMDARDYKSTIISSDMMKSALNLGKTPERMGDLNWILTYDATPANGKIEAKSKAKDLESLIRYSDAVDDINKRIYIEDNGTYNGATNSGGKDMTADTAYFDVGVEYSKVTESTTSEGFNGRVSFTDYKDEYKIDGNKILVLDENGKLKVIETFYAVNPYQDFGIIEKPRLAYETNKRISHIKITLSNGQVLINGKPYKQIPDADLYANWRDIETVGETLPYTKALPSQVLIEMDNEVIQGAILDVEYTISIKNDSELDYEYKNNQDYYYYGTNPTSQLTNVIKKVVDYMEDDLIYNKEQNENYGWTLVEPEKLKNWEENGLSKVLVENPRVYEAIEKGYTVSMTNAFDVSDFRIGTVKSVKMSGSKILSTDEGGIDVSNHVEILESIRHIWKSTPGNYNPDTETPNELDDGQTKIIITPPTGLENSKLIIIIPTIVISLVCLVIGIIFIKKKVLK